MVVESVGVTSNVRIGKSKPTYGLDAVTSQALLRVPRSDSLQSTSLTGGTHASSPWPRSSSTPLLHSPDPNPAEIARSSPSGVAWA